MRDYEETKLIRSTCQCSDLKSSQTLPTILCHTIHFLKPHVLLRVAGVANPLGIRRGTTPDGVSAHRRAHSHTYAI